MVDLYQPSDNTDQPDNTCFTADEKVRTLVKVTKEQQEEVRDT